VDQQQDEQDVEFEAFLRQFRPRTPPTFRAGGLSRLVTSRRLAIAAILLLACAIPFQLWRDKPAAQTSPSTVEVGLPPQPAGTVKPADVATNGGNKIAPRSIEGGATQAGIAGGRRPGVAAQYGPIRVGGAIKPPIRLVSVNAIYPEEARAAGIEGAVVMRITIGEDGSVTNVVVLRSVPLLDEAAIESVLQWQYQPTLLNGLPVEVEMNATVNFTLAN
jgi:TonB family protein